MCWLSMLCIIMCLFGVLCVVCMLVQSQQIPIVTAIILSMTAIIVPTGVCCVLCCVSVLCIMHIVSVPSPSYCDSYHSTYWSVFCCVLCIVSVYSVLCIMRIVSVSSPSHCDSYHSAYWSVLCVVHCVSVFCIVYYAYCFSPIAFPLWQLS